MLISGEYQSSVGPVVPVMVGPCDDPTFVLTKVQALLRKSEPRTIISLECAEKIGEPLPPQVLSQDTTVNILFRGDDGWAVFRELPVTIERHAPSYIDTETEVSIVIGRDVIDCGDLWLYEDDDRMHQYLFNVNTGPDIRPLLYRPGDQL